MVDGADALLNFAARATTLMPKLMMYHTLDPAAQEETNNNLNIQQPQGIYSTYKTQPNRGTIQDVSRVTQPLHSVESQTNTSNVISTTSRDFVDSVSGNSVCGANSGSGRTIKTLKPNKFRKTYGSSSSQTSFSRGSEAKHSTSSSALRSTPVRLTNQQTKASQGGYSNNSSVTHSNLSTNLASKKLGKSRKNNVLQKQHVKLKYFGQK